MTKACKGQLAAACDGKAIDLDHEAVQVYLAAHSREIPNSDRAPTAGADPPSKDASKPTALRPQRAKATKSPTTPRPRRPAQKAPPRIESEPGDAEDDPGDADDVEALIGQLTIDEVVRRFGTRAKFRAWLDARKKLEDIREKELKNDETLGRLIERELVKTHVFGAIEAGNRRLLGDTPKTLARRLYALAKSGAPVEEAEAVVREVISSQLQPVKATAARVLRNA